MTDQVILNKSILVDIGNAIREKEKSTDPIPTHEMANRILNLPSGGEKYYFRPQPQLNEYVDENGYFVKPDDWDDIESIDLPRNIDNMYFLYKVKDMDASWCALTVDISSQGTYITEFGRVRDGKFISLGSEYDLINNPVCNLKETFPNENYVVVHIYPVAPAYFTSFAGFKNCVINGITLTANAQPCLMRYGYLQNS